MDDLGKKFPQIKDNLARKNTWSICVESKEYSYKIILWKLYETGE